MRKSQSVGRQYGLPRKYDKQVHRGTQISRLSIEKLIAAMDSNNDGMITAADIQHFSEKHHLYMAPELTSGMVQEALSKRRAVFAEQLREPITCDEILGAVHVHYKLDSDHKWVPHERPFRKQWVILLEAIGERLPVDLPKIPIEKILAEHEKPPYPFAPKLNTVKEQYARVMEIIPKWQFSKVKSDTGLSLAKSQNITPIVISESQQDDAPINPFEKVINSRMQIYLKSRKRTSDLQYPVVTFEAKQYYQQAEKLSANPGEMAQTAIYKFIPDHTAYGQDSQRTIRQEVDEIRTPHKYRNQPVLLKSAYHGLGISREAIPRQATGTIFKATFQPENVETLKHRLAMQKQKEKEILNDTYVPPSAHHFREEVIDKTKPLYKTRLKPDPLVNPHMMSEHDQRPQFAIERDMRKEQYEQAMKQNIIDEYMGVFKQKKDWTKYFPQPDLQHTFTDNKRHPCLEKGTFQEPGLILMSLLREGAGSEDHFQLFHRQLRTIDKNQFLGMPLEY